MTGRKYGRRIDGPFFSEDALGAQAPEVIEQFLRAIGDDAAADALQSRGGSAQALWANPNAPYLATGVTYGFVDPQETTVLSDILPGTAVQPDRALAGRRIKVTLDHFHAAGYPGLGDGRRSILCEFEGRNQISGAQEPIHFARTLSVRNGDSAGLAGLPIFLGLTVGPNGIEFMGRTIYLGSKVDDTILGIFESDLYKKGLSLLSTAQPALAPLALTTGGIVRFLLKSRRNCEMHSFQFGLDFEGSGTSPRLRLGSYVVAQTADSQQVSMNDYRWCRDRQRLVAAAGGDTPITFNYMVFGVSPFVDKD